MLLYCLLTLLLPLLARGQQDSCFVLKDSKACPGLSNHAVQRTARYSNIQEFDAFIFGSLFRDQPSIEKFKTDFGCPGFEGGKQRYKRSVLCFAHIQNSRCTTSDTKTEAPHSLCKSICGVFRSSTRDLFSDSKICESNTTQTILSRRRDAVFVSPSSVPFSISTNVSLPAFCESLPSTTQDCMIGLVEDYEKCGFDTQKDSLEFCSANPALPCCLAGAQRQLVNLLNTPDLTEARRILVLAIAIFCIIIVYFVMMRLTSHRRAIPYEKESRAGSRSHYFGTPALLSMNDRMTPEIPQTHITRAPTAAKISTKGAPSPRSALPPSPPSETVMISFSEGRQPSVDSLSQIKQAYYSPRVASRTGVSAGGAWPPSPTSPASDSGTPKLGSPITYMTLRGFRIHSGRTYKVRRQQRAMMDSELNLKPGAVVRIFEVFDDGLAFGQAVDTGEKGYFDISCVETS